MLVGDHLREDNINVSRILFENLDVINKLYIDVMADNIEEEETGDESHAIICTMVSAHLLYNKTELESPLEYIEEDETIIANISESMAYLLTLEKLVEKGNMKRQIVDGIPFYSEPKKKMAKKKNKPDYPELELKSGVVVALTRSGTIHASYFDEANDFPSLKDSLIKMAEYFEGCDVWSVRNNIIDVWEKLRNHCREHDCGSIVIVENDG